MTNPPDPASLAAAAVRALEDEPLTREEFERLMAITPSEEDYAETDALLEWFQRRYPTAKARLDYVRRMTAMWSRSIPPAR